MSSDLAMLLLSTLEFILSAVLGFMFWKKGLHRRFPSMGAYLALRVVSSPIFSVLLIPSVQQQSIAKLTYFLLYYAVYIASAVLLFFVSMEVFRSAIAAFC